MLQASWDLRPFPELDEWSLGLRLGTLSHHFASATIVLTEAVTPPPTSTSTM